VQESALLVPDDGKPALKARLSWHNMAEPRVTYAPDEPRFRSAVRVFISYRRGDAVALAGRLYDRLSTRIGEDRVFMDHENIPPGDSFDEAIFRAIGSSDVLLVLIGPKWVELMKPGTPGSDWVVAEIVAALKRGIPVVPVLLGNTPLPAVSDLPSEIQHLATRQALQLDPGVRFSSDFDRLMKALSPFGRKSGPFGRILSWLRR
jgi:hypothetical protein